ncbi:response regulator [Actinoplanes sp. LDG1-06]|uniref:histidine kinase n=1 Tax=Paractinoplanes ovalisporus TaxID=2810368 RepID=A0ABS2AG81_9ACTN|nr:response regulator [Actinoplanes ovalisporus]MBM2618821.1 response regulator [Actinoplanes ovalisporus]
MTTSVLVVDDNDDDAVLIGHSLTRAGLRVRVTREETAEGVTRALAEDHVDVVICDYNLPSVRAEDVLAQVREHDSDLPFVLVSGQVGEEVAVDLMRAGARDFVLKDRLARLAPAVQRELHEAAERRAHRRSEQALRLLAEHAHDVIFRFRLRPEPAMEYVSSAVEAITGHAPEEFYADPALIFRLVEPEDRPLLERSWQSEQPGTLTIRWRHRSGGPAWVEQRANAVAGPDGRPVAVEGILRDITERVRMEEQLRQAERLDSLGRLAGGIAHDFNNILAVISGYAVMLTEELGSDHVLHADARAIEQAAARGSGLTRQLLIFSGLEPSRPEPLDLNAVATDMQRLLSRTLGDDIELTTMLSLDLPPVRMDRNKLEQVVMNAAMNARAAMPDGGRLTLTTEVERTTGQVGLSMTDTGCGMEASVAARAFEPFFTTKGRGRGTGLGLATAYGVVTDAGGTISLDSTVGAGTTLRISLPPAELVARPSTLVRRRSHGGKVLVVEDEDGVRDIVGRILRRAGYEVVTAADPAEALRLCREENLTMDVLVTDIIMPGMSGTQLAAELRRSRPDLPVLFMSGYTSGPAPGGQELPADAPLLHKPFQTDHLLSAMHRVLP